MVTIRRAAILLFGVLSCGLVSTVGGQERLYQYHIQLRVFSEDIEVRTLISNYMSRELRSLPDVLISDQSPDYKISVLALVDKNGDGRVLSYALTTSLTSPKATGYIDALLQGKVPASAIEALKVHFEGAEVPLNRYLNTADSNTLQELCKGIIAKIDGEHIEANRKVLSGSRTK